MPAGRPPGSYVDPKIAMITRPGVSQVMHWKHWKDVKRIPGDVREYIERIWAPKIPKLYEGLFDAARNGEHVSEQALDILKTMTLMTPSLTPAGLRTQVNADGLGLPSDVDLTHLTLSELSRLARKELSAPLDHKENARKSKHAKAMRDKKAKIIKGEAAAAGPHTPRRVRAKPTDGGHEAVPVDHSDL